MKSAVLLCASLHCFAANWPQFRGPQASGVDDSRPAPTTWNVETGENIRWKTEIPGLSHSSPIIWNDRIYVITATSGSEAELKVGLYGDIESASDTGLQEWRLLALEKKSGKLIWDKPGYKAVPRVKRHTKASHANSTPATDGKHIAAIFGSEGLFCFDTKGELLWHRDLGPMDSGFFRAPSAQWGFASSPVIYKDRVVVQCDVQTNSFIAAFDVKTGNELWRTARSDAPTWSTPTISKGQVLANGWHEIASYDLKDGRELWKFDGGPGGDIPVPTPVVSGQIAFFTSAHGPGRPMRAIDLDKNGKIVWEQPRHGNYMQTPTLVAHSLYGCFDNGILTCFDTTTGKIHYSERLGSGREGFTASPVSDGRNLYLPSELGNVHVVAASTQFRVVATNALGETCMASPALSEGTLFFRTRRHLTAIAR